MGKDVKKESWEIESMEVYSWENHPNEDVQANHAADSEPDPGNASNSPSIAFQNPIKKNMKNPQIHQQKPPLSPNHQPKIKCPKLSFNHFDQPKSFGFWACLERLAQGLWFDLILYASRDFMRFPDFFKG